MLGADQPQHGAASGACAYRTISYALANATGKIFLAAGSYPSGGDKTPYELTGRQVLVGDVTDASKVVFAATGDGISIVNLSGERNGVDHCTFASGPVAVIILTSASSASEPHFVTSCVTTTYEGVRIAVGGNRFLIQGNKIHGTGYGINIGQQGATGQILGNDLVNGQDMSCSDPSPGITGSGNVRGGGPPVCAQCQYCPFQ